jgi:hypothetical protein
MGRRKISRSFFINWIKDGLGPGTCIMKVTMRMGLNVVLNIRSFWLWNCMNVMVICGVGGCLGDF